MLTWHVYAGACHTCTCVCMHLRLEVDMCLLSLFNFTKAECLVELGTYQFGRTGWPACSGVPSPILVSQHACSAFAWVLGIHTPVFTLCMANTLSTGHLLVPAIILAEQS